MKGLLLTHMGRREEGIDLVKKGMRFDLTSHICWHVFGLIQKGEKNYEEALKSYTQALRFDKVSTQRDLGLASSPKQAHRSFVYTRPYIHHLQENLNILRDSAHLQTQLRTFDALVETRHTLLRLRPNLRQNWVALAVAYHLNGECDEAKKVLERYESILKVFWAFLTCNTTKLGWLGRAGLRCRALRDVALSCSSPRGTWGVLRSSESTGHERQVKSNCRQNGSNGTERYCCTHSQITRC